MIKVSGLCKSFGEKKALKNISFNIKSGEILGIVGHNGAGKSTLINCMIKIHKIDEGKIQYAFNTKNFYDNIGVQMQQSHFEHKAKVIDICNLYKGLTNGQADIFEFLHEFDLYNERNSYIKNLSGGNRQRLSILLTMLNNPKIIFLDELTTGLDPVARRKVWEALKKINDQYGTTIILTSHFLDEIEYLSDKILIMNKGEIIYSGTVREVIDNNVQCEKLIEFKLKNKENENLLREFAFNKINDSRYQINSNDDEEILKYLLSEVGVENLTVKSPTFEDIFLKMTGYKLDKDGKVINE